MPNLAYSALDIHPTNRLVIPILLLEEEVHMLLLDNKGQLEPRDMERQLLRIEDSQHVNLLHDSLHAPLQLSHPLFIAGILLQNMLHNIMADRDLLIQIHLLERSRE
jgi:hypothetical protein